jgi:KDO2-lipid IV(A) lauroyltransferase
MKWIYLFFLRPLSHLPYGFLYVISSALSFVLMKVLKYRKDVIQGNLIRSFPEYSELEIKQIETKFGRHFCDLIVEVIKHFSVRESQLTPRMTFEGTEVLDAFYEQGKHVVIAGGHQNNWELYAVTAARPISHQLTAIYKRLSNPYMDGVMRESRQRFGLHMIPTIQAKEWAELHLASGAEPKQAVVFGFDQSPADPRKSWWTTFLHQETAWYWGMEQFARKHDMPVVFGHITKLSRGHYACRYEVVVEAPQELPEGAIISRCIQLLETNIKAEPAHWLWTHKRWKHRRPEDVKLNPLVL